MAVVCEMRLVIAVHWRTGERERERGCHTVVVVCEMRLVTAVRVAQTQHQQEIRELKDTLYTTQSPPE